MKFLLMKISLSKNILEKSFFIYLSDEITPDNQYDSLNSTVNSFINDLLRQSRASSSNNSKKTENKTNSTTSTTSTPPTPPPPQTNYHYEAATPSFINDDNLIIRNNSKSNQRDFPFNYNANNDIKQFLSSSNKQYEVEKIVGHGSYGQVYLFIFNFNFKKNRLLKDMIKLINKK